MFNLAEVNPQPTKVKIKIPKRLYMLFSIIILTSKGLVASDKASWHHWGIIILLNIFNLNYIFPQI